LTICSTRLTSIQPQQLLRAAGSKRTAAGVETKAGPDKNSSRAGLFIFGYDENFSWFAP
jgi:hypothetical protein